MTHFENLFVFGRPAAGKSEFIDFMKRCEPAKRLNTMHIAPFDMVDDYLFIKDISENETIFEKLSVPRQITKVTKDGIMVVNEAYFPFATEKLNIIFGQKYIANPGYYKERTVLIEFSRGVRNFGYNAALNGLKKEILDRGAIIYIKASYEESLRRNEARYQEKLKYSILAHKCPEEGMERYYKNDDWNELTAGKECGCMNIGGAKLPFVTMNNEPESKDESVMEKRYTEALDKLIKLCSAGL